MKNRLGWMLICLCFAMAVAGNALAEDAAPVILSCPPIDRMLYPSPDVPQSARVDDAYFKDAVFIGDSILSGLQVHDVVPEARFACEIGTSASRALRSRVIQYNNQYLTLIDYAMLKYSPKKVYVMLGTNGLNIVKPDRVLADMRDLIAYVVETWPEVIVYIISLPPVSPAATDRHRLLNNDNIVMYNEGLRQIAQEYQVFYLHTNPLFTQEDGSLERSFAAKDGYHMLQRAHEIFADYLYTHTVPYDESLEWLVSEP